MNEHTLSSAIHSTGGRPSRQATYASAGMLSLALSGLLLLGGCNKGPAPAAPAAEPAPTAQANSLVVPASSEELVTNGVGLGACDALDASA